MSKKLLCVIMAIIFMVSTVVSVSVSAEMGVDYGESLSTDYEEYSTEEEIYTEVEETTSKYIPPIYADIYPGKRIALESPNGNGLYLQFVPEETGVYVFESDDGNSGVLGVNCCLYDSQMNVLVYTDVIYYDDFSVSYYFTAGETYYFYCGGSCDSPGFIYDVFMENVYGESSILPYLSYEIVNGEVIISRISCRSLYGSDIIFPETIEGYPVTEIKAAFAGGEFKTIVIPDSAKKIDLSICEANVDRVVIGDSVEEISYIYISVCNVKDFVFGNSIKRVCMPVFGDYGYIENIYMSDAEFWNSLEFDGANGTSLSYIFQSGSSVNLYFNNELVTDLIIPDTITTLRTEEYYSFGSIEKVVTGNSVTSIPQAAFAHCANLKSVEIGASVSTIASAAFAHCKSLRTITIPESVESIGKGAFNGTSLREIVINNPDCIIAADASTIPTSALIYGYAGSTAQEYAEMFDKDFVAIDSEEPSTDVEEPSTETGCVHSYGKWTIEIMPTCTQRGFMYRECSLCGDVEYNTLNPAGHNDADNNGICDVCDEVLSSQTPDIDEGGESDDNGSSGGILSFMESIKDLFNKIILWFRTIFGIA